MRVSRTACTGQGSSGFHHAPQAVHLQAAADQPCLCPCQTRATSLAKLCQSPIGAPSLTILPPLQASFILTHRLGREFNFIHYVRESMDDDFSKWVLRAASPGTAQRLLSRLSALADRTTVPKAAAHQKMLTPSGGTCHGMGPSFANNVQMLHTATCGACTHADVANTQGSFQCSGGSLQGGGCQRGHVAHRPGVRLDLWSHR